MEFIPYNSQSELHVFNPGEGTKHMEYILQTTIDLEPQNIIFHHFSIGGFLYGQMLRIFKDSPNKRYGRVIPKIKGQIFDSPLTCTLSQKDLAHFFPSKSHPLHFLVKICVEIYMKLTAESNGREWKASSEIFHANFLTHAPSLWYYSAADPVSRYQDCERVIESGKLRHGRYCRSMGCLLTFNRKEGSRQILQ